MAQSWEIANNVLVGILTRETVSTAWCSFFRNLQIPGTYTFLSGMEFSHARNTICQKTLEMGFDWCMHIDDDTIPPVDVIPRLLAHKKPIVSGLYYRRNEPICPVMLRNGPDGKTKEWITTYKIPDLMEVDYVGAGCLLIHRSVLETLPPITPHRRWFNWQVDDVTKPPEERTSEDFSFNTQARKAGFKILVDTSIQCRHAGLSQSECPGVLKPLVI